MGLMIRRLLLLSMLAIASGALIMFVADRGWSEPDSSPAALSMAQNDMTALLQPVVVRVAMSRPLFFEGRRLPVQSPPQSVMPAPPVMPPPFPAAELLGVFGAPGDAMGLVLRSEGQTSRVRLGEEWSGWQLVGIDLANGNAAFASPSFGRHEIALKRQPQQGGMVTPPEILMRVIRGATEDPARSDQPEVNEASKALQEDADSSEARRQRLERMRAQREPRTAQDSVDKAVEAQQN